MDIFKNRFLLFLLFLPFFKPQSFSYNNVLDLTFNLFRIIVAILVIVIYILNDKYSYIILAIGILQLILVLSTFINHGDYIKCIINSATIISISMLVELSMKKNFIGVFQVLFYLLSSLSYLNLILLIFIPQGFAPIGVERVNFIGIDNHIAIILLPLIGISVIYSLLKYKKIKIWCYLSILVVSLNLILIWSATGIMGWTIIVLYFLIGYNKYLDRLFNFKVCFITNMIMFISIIVLRIQNIFSFLIEDILHKNLTFTGRTYIWDYAMNLISKKPLLGYGIRSEELIPTWYGNLTAHNAILQFMIDGGLVSAFIYILIILICGYQIDRHKEYKISKIILIIIFSFLMMMLMESYRQSIFFYMLLVMGFNISLIKKYDCI